VTSSLTVRRVRVPFRVPFETAAGTWGARDSLLVELRTDGGARGIGEAVVDGEATAEALTAQLQLLMDGPGDTVPEALRHAFAAGMGGALLDLAPGTGKAAGARQSGVAVNATIGAIETGEAVEAVGRAVAAGFGTIKLKAGARESTSALRDRLLAVRAAAGPGVALRLDVNGTWDPEEAVRRLRALEAVGLQYVEQPLAVGARGATARLRARVRVPIAADEAVISPAVAEALVRGGATDVLVVKPARVGGPAAVAEIALMAAANGVPVVVSSLFETGIGLAAALACAASLPDVDGWPAVDRAHGLATADLLEDDLIVEPLVIERGRVRAPFGAGCGGLGVTVDEAAVARYLVDRP
jgi:o-succinylbenzoate synthase